MACCLTGVHRTKCERIDGEGDDVMIHNREVFLWVWKLGNGRDEADYFWNNVSRLAKLYNVQRHELALSELPVSRRPCPHSPLAQFSPVVTRSFQQLDFPEIHHPLDSPSEDLYIYTHFDDNGDVAAAYWSFDDKPGVEVSWTWHPGTRTINDPFFAMYVVPRSILSDKIT